MAVVSYGNIYRYSILIENILVLYVQNYHNVQERMYL